MSKFRGVTHVVVVKSCVEIGALVPLFKPQSSDHTSPDL